MYTIKQVAEKTGISAHTLRFYDNEGLFPFVSRDGNNVRLFSDEDLRWVATVQCLRDTGMPLAEVREYVQLCLLGDSTIISRYDMIQRQAQKAEAELAAMEARVAYLRTKADRYKSLLEQHQPDVCNPLNQGASLDAKHFEADRAPLALRSPPASATPTAQRLRPPGDAASSPRRSERSPWASGAPTPAQPPRSSSHSLVEDPTVTLGD